MNRLPYSLILGFLLVSPLPLLGCGDEGSAGPVGSEGGDGGGAGGAGAEGGGAWGGSGGSTGVLNDFDCTEPAGSLGEPVFFECEEPNSDGPIDCAVVDVPLDWCAEDGERISFFFRRFPHRGEAPRGQLWYLPGGPGSSGAATGHRLRELRDLGFDVYVPDYRGVGQSTALNCAGEGENEVSMRCLDELEGVWGDSLRHFSTTGAVFDIGGVIAALRGPDEPVFLLGGSYGTFVLNRFLHLFPDQVTAAVMDGVCNGAGCEVRFDRNRDRVARDVLEYCGTDPFCSSKLTTDPVAWITELMEDVRAGHCNEVFGAETEARLTEAMIENSRSRASIAVGLSFAYRLARCDPADRAALRHHAFGPEASNALGGHSEKSGYLYFNIFLNEFWPDGFTLADAQAEAQELLFRGSSTIDMARTRSIWPWPFFSAPDELKSWAKTDRPLLLFTGALDTQTPLSALHDVEDAFPHPHQHFVPIPWGPHNNVFAVDSGKRLDEMCIGGMFLDFFRDPTAELDRSCVADLPPPDLEWTGHWAQVVYGTDDLWENPPDEEEEEAPTAP